MKVAVAAEANDLARVPPHDRPEPQPRLLKTAALCSATPATA